MKTTTIEKLREMGARLWENYGKKRLYLGQAAEEIAELKVERYNTGNIAYAEYEGEKISNTEATRLSKKLATVYVDLDTDTLYVDGKDATNLEKESCLVKEAIEKIANFIAEEEKEEEVTEATETTEEETTEEESLVGTEQEVAYAKQLLEKAYSLLGQDSDYASLVIEKRTKEKFWEVKHSLHDEYKTLVEKYGQQQFKKGATERSEEVEQHIKRNNDFKANLDALRKVWFKEYIESFKVAKDVINEFKNI